MILSISRIAILVSLTAAGACRDGAEAPAPIAASPKAAGVEARGAIVPVVTDLDRPVEELFAERCEHDKPTFECDECRYGVGVVKAPAALFAGGLLKTAVVAERTLDATVELTGEVRFDERRVTHLSPTTEGILRRALVTLGDRVKPGQPLVEIESVSFGEAEGQLLEAQATMRLARRSFERQQELKAEQITSEREFLQAQQEYEAAAIRATAAGDKLLRLGLAPGDLATLQANRVGAAKGRLVIRAPAAGTVLFMHAVPGQLVRPEESLIMIGDSSVLWVWADLYERDLAAVTTHNLQDGLEAEIGVRAFPEESFLGRVAFIDPAMDESTRTVKVRVEVANPQGKLRAGMFANVRLTLPGNGSVVAVPAAAVLQDEGRSFVFVHHHDDYYVRRPVDTGRSTADWIEITRGVASGQTVVAEGCFLLKSDVLRSKMGAGCAD